MPETKNQDNPPKNTGEKPFDEKKLYFSFLPERFGLFSGSLMRLLFSRIGLSPEQAETIRHLPEDAIIVYCVKHRTLFELLFYNIRYKKENLPHTHFTFGFGGVFTQPVFRVISTIWRKIRYFFKTFSFPDPYRDGTYRQALLNGAAAMLPLIGERAFTHRFIKAKPDPIQFLVELQASINRPVYIVPHVMFFSHTAQHSRMTVVDILFGTKEKPKLIRRLFTLLQKPKSVFVEIGDPVHVADFVRRHPVNQYAGDHQAVFLRQDLILRINRIRQSITGPLLKTKIELKESILTSSPLREYMDHYSKTRNTSIYKTHRKADGYLDEIAANYNNKMIAVYSPILTFIFHTMYEGVSVNQDMIGRLKAMSRKAPLILIPCHKSHIDYLILSYLLYHNNMPCPHVAAGRNLSFWPMGPLFRAGGAFFLRRTFKGALLYAKVFSSYVHKLLEEGYNVEYFIEGGRSRTGKLLMPKMGLMNILFSALINGACEDLILVPIFLGYDQVLEEDAYLHELEGGKKEPESVSQIIRARKFLKKRYGKIYIRFHEPISVQDYVAKTGNTIEALSPRDQNEMVNDLSFRVVSAIDRITVVTPHALVASSILNCAKTRFSFESLWENIQTYMNFLTFQGATLTDTLVMDAFGAVRHVTETYLSRKFILQISGDEKNVDLTEAQFQVNIGKRPILNYYTNTCASQFMAPAVGALSILKKDAFQFCSSDLYEDFEFLTEFLRFEFCFDPDHNREYHVRKSIKAFIDQAILMPHPTMPDTYNITSAGLRKLILFAGFLTTYLESYWIVLQYILKTESITENAKEHLKRIMALGGKMFRKEMVERKESLSGMNFKNGLTYFKSHGIKGAKDRERIEFYLETIKTYLKFAPR